MALTKTITLNSGLTVANAYLKVSQVNGNKDNLRFVLLIFVSEQTSNQNKAHVDLREYYFKPADAENSLRWDKQCYEYLKTLNEYADAIDI